MEVYYRMLFNSLPASLQVNQDPIKDIPNLNGYIPLSLILSYTGILEKNYRNCCQMPVYLNINYTSLTKLFMVTIVSFPEAGGP